MNGRKKQRIQKEKKEEMIIKEIILPANHPNWKLEMNNLVYKLYDLTEEEVGIIEKKTLYDGETNI